MRHYPQLNPEAALIWRIVHVNSVPWILRNGLHCAASDIRDPNFEVIGNTELIDKRSYHPVPKGPKGFLRDYVPFYFTPFSPMMANIFSARGGVKIRKREELCILVTNLKRIATHNLGFVFTDRHALLELADYCTNLDELNKINWPLLQARDYRKDMNNLLPFEQYQAEALVHQHVPMELIPQIVCYNASVQQKLKSEINSLGLKTKVLVRAEWYL